jgi:hypothetical protein
MMAPDPPLRRRGKKQQSTSHGSVEGGQWLVESVAATVAVVTEVAAAAAAAAVAAASWQRWQHLLM